MAVLTDTKRNGARGSTRAPEARPLLTVGYGNPKTAKGEKVGYRTAVLHLAPHTLSGRNVCPMATAGCAAACLNSAGRGGMSTKGLAVADIGEANAIQRARVRRTLEYFADRPRFMTRLADEVARFVKHCDRVGLKPCVRLNGTSDLRFESVPCGDSPSIMHAFPSLQFYDYTKLGNRRNLPANYHLTYSLAEGVRNWRGHIDALANGYGVAVVLRGCGDSVRPLPFPKTWAGGRTLVDGDLSDLRFLDAPGVYVGLRAKGRARHDTSGFVFEAHNPPRPLPILATL